MTIRVLIADDHTVVRRGVAQILADDPEIEVVSQAASGRQVLKAVQEQGYDVLLLDIAMPEGSGLEVLEELRHLTHRPHVLILSMYPEKQYAIRALKLGADGYLTKESLPEELLAAIHKVASGGKYVNQALTEQLALELTAIHGSNPLKTLSEREYQIMGLLARGKSVTEIARELALSASSVSTYRVRVLKKLGLNSTAEIIRYAIQNKLVE
ncbi:MAG: DNA-binding response regulator [Chloroflexi bacterium]|nr:MAG: DNA-binding response regulator [Chloroflexota bacterium]